MRSDRWLENASSVGEVKGGKEGMEKRDGFSTIRIRNFGHATRMAGERDSQ